MRSAGHCTPQRWPLLLAAGVAVLCASTALASRSVPASDLRAALTTSPTVSPTALSPAAAPAALPAAPFALDPAGGSASDLATDLTPSPFRPLTGEQGTVHAVADGDGVIAESYLVRPDGTVQIYGSDRTPPRLVLGRVRPLVAGQPQTLQLVFSEDVQATGTTAVALSGPGGTPHPLTLDPASGRVWTATLDPTLLPGDAFTLTVSGVEDLAGNQILPQSLPFVAPEPALGLVLPGTAEADLLAVLDGPTGLALVLGTPVDPGAIPAGLVSVKRAGLAVAGSVSVHTGGAQPLEGAVLMWTPTDPQAYQPGACEVTVAAGLVDLAGHPIHGPPDAIAYDHSGQGDVVWARPEDAQILSASQVGNDRFLHGRPLVATLGLYDHRARFYDPTTQTFLEPDPLGPVDSPNLYQAFGLDPQNNTDPLGLESGATFTAMDPENRAANSAFTSGERVTPIDQAVSDSGRGYVKSWLRRLRESYGNPVLLAYQSARSLVASVQARVRQAKQAGGTTSEGLAIALGDQVPGLTSTTEALAAGRAYEGPMTPQEQAYAATSAFVDASAAAGTALVVRGAVSKAPAATTATGVSTTGVVSPRINLAPRAKVYRLPDVPGIYQVEAAGITYTGHAFKLRARLLSATHPAAEAGLLDDVSLRVTYWPVDLSAVPALRVAIARALGVNEQQVMNLTQRLPGMPNVLNKIPALSPEKLSLYGEQYPSTRGVPVTLR